MKRFLIIPIVAVLGLVSVPSSVSAAAKAPAASNAQQLVSQRRCTVAKARIQHRIDMLNNAIDSRHELYQHAHDRATVTITNLKQAGYDTTKLEADLLTIQNGLVAYRKHADTLLAALEQARLDACGESDTLFVASLQKARTELQATRAEAQKIHQLYQATIVPDLKDAAAWLKAHTS